MARIRTIKPDFFGSKDITSLPRFTARVTFEGVWCQADDEGRLRYDDPRILKGTIWPLDDWHTWQDVAQDIACLVEAGLLIHYVVPEPSGSLPGVLPERSYLAVTNWHHQKISHPTPSRLPAPSAGRAVPLTCTERNVISRCGPVPGGLPEDSSPRARAPEVEVEVEEERDTDSLRESGAAAAPPREPGPRAVADVESALLDADVEEKPITAQTCVAAWVDASRANGVQPIRAQIARVGKLAKALIEAGNHPEMVLTACESAGTGGYETIDRELAAMNGRRRPGARNGAKPSHTDARVAAGLSLVEELAREEAAAAAAQTPKEITR